SAPSILTFSYCCCSLLFSILIPPSPRSTLFPYTTLFRSRPRSGLPRAGERTGGRRHRAARPAVFHSEANTYCGGIGVAIAHDLRDRKSTRLNSSHGSISYAVFCLKKKTLTHTQLHHRNTT